MPSSVIGYLRSLRNVFLMTVQCNGANTFWIPRVTIPLLAPREFSWKTIPVVKNWIIFTNWYMCCVMIYWCRDGYKISNLYKISVAPIPAFSINTKITRYFSIFLIPILFQLQQPQLLFLIINRNSANTIDLKFYKYKP